MSQAAVLRAYDEIATFFARGPSQREIAAFQLSEQTVERIRELLEKNAADTLTSNEADELEQVGHLNRMLLLIRSRIPPTDTPLFHPRSQRWTDHFRWNGPLIEPLTDVGRATVFFLRLNDPVQVEVRANLRRQGRW